MLALVFDNTGTPRFLQEILGVTKQLGYVEFIVRFKYSRQERLIDGKRLKSRVPQMVRQMDVKNFTLIHIWNHQLFRFKNLYVKGVQL